MHRVSGLRLSFFAAFALLANSAAAVAVGTGSCDSCYDRTSLPDAIGILGDAPAHGLAVQEDNQRRLQDIWRYTHSLSASANLPDNVSKLIEHSLLSYALDFTLGGRAPTEDDVERLRDAIRTAGANGTLQDWYKSLIPTHAAYHTLRAAYLTLQRQNGVQWPVIGPGETLEYGSTGPRVDRLRIRLGLNTENNAEQPFDDELRLAVQAYQQRNGLEADGKVGKRSLAHLDTPRWQRLRQLEINLARWRQLQEPATERHIIVNLPSYELQLNGVREEPLTMKVIVGSRKNPTPLFSDRIERLVFSPYWYVPERIAIREVLPKIARDDAYRQHQGFEVIDKASGRLVAQIDWERIKNGEMPYWIRQRPGPKNALGGLKFILPNSQQIYLHDTSSPQLFARSERALSHGCIRLSEPALLAQSLTSDDWTQQSVAEAMVLNEPTSVRPKSPVQVTTTYFTATADEAGTVAFFDDIYGYDTAHTAPMASTYLPQIEPRDTERLLASSQ